MAKISRSDFLTQTRDKSLDVGAAGANPGLAGVDVKKADLNRDGKIRGDGENAALFAEVDRFDRDGSAQTIALKDPTGAPTKGARILDVLAASMKPDGDGGSSAGAKVADAAKKLVAEKGQNYGVSSAWVNVDPNHALPANVPLGGLKGKWKCNLFAGNTVYAAGFQPPYYGNRGSGEYPNANQLYKWADKYAAQFGNKTHFQLGGELAVASVPAEQREAMVLELLKQVKPGDLIIVYHMGTDVADGGHCRVALNNAIGDGSGTIDCAQASYDAAVTRAETVGAFTGEEHIWILRPNKPR